MTFSCHDLNAKSYVPPITFERVLVWRNETKICDEENESETEMTGRSRIKESSLKTQQEHLELGNRAFNQHPAR